MMNIQDNLYIKNLREEKRKQRSEFRKNLLAKYGNNEKFHSKECEKEKLQKRLSEIKKHKTGAFLLSDKELLNIDKRQQRLKKLKKVTMFMSNVKLNLDRSPEEKRINFLNR